MLVMLTTFTRLMPRPYHGKKRSPGPHGSQPTLAEAAAETESKANSPASSAEAEEGNVRRRPQRMIASIDRPRPPAPVPAINEPASVVIRRPAPGLVGNPGPAVVGLIHPAAIAVRRPTGAFRRETTRCRNREHCSTGRSCPDLACPCSRDWCVASFARPR